MGRGPIPRSAQNHAKMRAQDPRMSHSYARRCPAPALTPVRRRQDPQDSFLSGRTG